jgi:hypothetical protein
MVNYRVSAPDDRCVADQGQDSPVATMPLLPAPQSFFMPMNAQASPFIGLAQRRARDESYDGDTVHHEMTHAVLAASGGYGFLDSLGWNSLPAALAEGYADYFAAAMRGDPNLSSYFGPAFVGKQQ